MITKLTKYKQTGIKWIPELPEHWEIFRLGNFFRERTEIVSDKEFKPLSVTMQGILPQLESIAKTDNGDNRKKVCIGDFVINSRSDRKGSGGVSKYEGSVSVISNVLKSNEKFNLNYTNYLFTNKLFQEEYYYRGKGIVADMWSTKYKEMRNILIPLPPLPEQKIIAEYLDKKIDKINHFISQKQKFIALLKEQRQGIINEAVTKGIDKSVKLKHSGIDWLGEIPEHWEVRRLRYCGECQNGLNKGGEYFGSGYPFVGYGDVYNNEIIPAKTSGLVQSDENDRNNYSVIEGDIFFTRTSEVIEEIATSSTCFSTIKDATFSGFLIRFRPHTNLLYKGYSSFFFRSQILRKFFVKEMNIITRASMSQDLLKSLPVLIPPQTEQKQIAIFIKSETQKIDHTISQAEKEIELIKEYKEAMIAEAVMGKVNIKETKAPQSITTKKEANWEFKEAVLISVLTDKFGSDQYPLGRKRYTKYSYLFHRHTDNKTEGYLKKAAGPYNPKTKYGGPEKIALQNKYISEVQNGNLSGFVASDKIEDARNYFGNYWNTESLNWLQQLRYKKNDELELYATVDKAMVELADSNKDINLQLVKQIIDEHPEWKPKLERDIFSDDNIAKAMEFLKHLFQ